MKYLAIAAMFAAGSAAAHLTGVTVAADPDPAAPPAGRAARVANPSIDMPGHLLVAREAEQHRAARRLTEEEFITMAAEPGTVVLDARSKEMYDLLHVRGAVNLSFPDIDAVSLPRLIPDKATRIVIYCNNNFTPAAAGTLSPAQAAAAANTAGKPGTPADVAPVAFRPKSAVTSLNISTYTALYAYGYRNVYELGPLVDPAKTKIPFASTRK